MLDLVLKLILIVKALNIVEFCPPIEGSEEGLIRSMEEIEEHMVGGGNWRSTRSGRKSSRLSNGRRW